MTGDGAVRRMVVGVGFTSTATPDALVTLVRACLEEYRVADAEVVVVATVEGKHVTAPVVHLAGALGAQVQGVPRSVLARIDVAEPSAAALSALGVPSVAEGCVRALGATPLGPVRRMSGVTCSVGWRSAGLDRR